MLFSTSCHGARSFPTYFLIASEISLFYLLFVISIFEKSNKTLPEMSAMSQSMLLQIFPALGKSVMHAQPNKKNCTLEFCITFFFEIYLLFLHIEFNQ